MTTLEELMVHRPQVDLSVELSQTNIDEFRNLGFTRIERIAPDEELEWLGQVYDRLFADRVEPMPGAFVELVRSQTGNEDLQAQIIMPEVKLPELCKTMFWRNGRKLAAQLLGVDAKDLRGWGHMIRKPPRVADFLPWHQDEAYWDPSFDYCALGCWMPLDPATVESGCMSYIPRSHLGELYMHHRYGGEHSDHVVHVEGVDESQAVPAPLAAGGAVFHHRRTLHSSGPNLSARVRRAYANEWQLEPVRREIPAPRPWFEETRRARQEREAAERAKFQT